MVRKKKNEPVEEQLPVLMVIEGHTCIVLDCWQAKECIYELSCEAADRNIFYVTVFDRSTMENWNHKFSFRPDHYKAENTHSEYMQSMSALLARGK